PWNWQYWDRIHRRGSAGYDAWNRESKEIGRQARATRISASNLMIKWVVRDVAGHPFLWVRMVAVRPLALPTCFVNSQKPEAFRVGPINGRVVYTVFHVLLNAMNFLLIGCAVWFLIAHRGHLASYWPLWGPWLSLALFHAVVYAEPRYLFPSRP